jgi:hypothetical protein
MGHKLLKGLIAGLRGREARRVECAEEIALLCHDLGTCKQIVALGGVQALVENLKGTNVSAREAAMGALANLGRDNEAASVVRLSGLRQERVTLCLLTCSVQVESTYWCV